MTFSSLSTNPNLAADRFAQLDADDQLALLWFVYTKIGQSVTPAAPDAASPQIVEGLFNQFKELSQDDQLEEMRALVNRRSTLISREYGSLSANSQLALWYRLAQGMETGTIVPMPDGYTLSQGASELLGAIESMDFEQQITLLRNVAASMGAEPGAGAAL